MRLNADKARAAMQRWRATHPEAHRAEGRAHYARHTERLRARTSAYHRAYPAVGRTKSQKHRARRLAAPGSFTPAQWRALVAAYRGRCAYCGDRSDLEAGMAKLFATEMCQEVTLEAMRIYGGFGYTKEFNVERYYRDAPFMLVGEGTSEIQRLVIARQLLEKYKM